MKNLSTYDEIIRIYLLSTVVAIGFAIGGFGCYFMFEGYISDQRVLINQLIDEYGNRGHNRQRDDNPGDDT